MEESALPLFITYSVNVLGYFVVDQIGGYHGGTSFDSDHTTRNDRLPMSLGSFLTALLLWHLTAVALSSFDSQLRLPLIRVSHQSALVAL